MQEPRRNCAFPADSWRCCPSPAETTSESPCRLRNPPALLVDCFNNNKRSPVGDSWDPVGGKSQDGRRILGRAFTHSDIQTLVTSDFGGPGPRDAVLFALHEPVMRMSTSIRVHCPTT